MALSTQTEMSSSNPILPTQETSQKAWPLWRLNQQTKTKFGGTSTSKAIGSSSRNFEMSSPLAAVWRQLTAISMAHAARLTLIEPAACAGERLRLWTTAQDC